MNNKHYLIHKDDYIKHIDEKVLLYMMVKQLTFQIDKLTPTKKNEALRRVAKHYSEMIDAMFQTWGIPGSYLVFSKESDLAELMENELIAPEDAGYYPIDDEEDDNCNFECRCGDCCGCCAEDEADGFDDDEDGVESVDDFIEMLGAMSAVIHNIFGDKVSVHIVIEE